jgi:hypothetical protein
MKSKRQSAAIIKHSVTIDDNFKWIFFAKNVREKDG